MILVVFEGYIQIQYFYEKLHHRYGSLVGMHARARRVDRALELKNTDEKKFHSRPRLRTANSCLLDSEHERDVTNRNGFV